MTTVLLIMCEKLSAEPVSAKDYSDELYALGRLAFEALLQGQLYFPVSQLPAGYSLIERLIEVGLFQVLNMASLNREKGVYFIHKSVQEYLAANFLKEELTSKKAESTNSLLKLDSVEKIEEMTEVLKFAVQLSEEAAREIVIHLGMKSGLKEFKFDNETPSQEDLSKEQTNFINLCNWLFFSYCSAETRKNLFPTFLSSLGGVLVINAKKLNVIVQEKLVQTTEKTPNYVFFDTYPTEEQDYSNLIILTQQLNAVIVSSAGEKKASEFLSNLTWRRIEEFFLKKEENNTHLYLTKIVTLNSEIRGIAFPCDIIKALISKQETTKKTNMNGDESSEESSSSCCSKRHGLSRVGEINALWVNRSEVELMSQMMPSITAPHRIYLHAKAGEVFDAELTESLLRSIPITHKLKGLKLSGINLTSSPAVEFINNVFKKAPNLDWLNMSENPLLGAGVDSLIKHLSCAPHLKTLHFYGVKMTSQQVMDLSSAIKQYGNITYLNSSYHDGKGNPKPEHEWPPEDVCWEEWLYPILFSDSSNESQPQRQQVDSLSESEDEEEEERDEEGIIQSEEETAEEMSSYESEDNQDQILAETRLSIHDSPFPADDQDTVETFPAPPDPAVKEEFPGRKQKARKKRKVQEMTEEIDEPRRKKKKRKKEKAEQRTEAGDEESPRKRKKRKKRKVHRMTEDVEGTSLKRRKRKKHKEHRRDKGGEESTRKGKTRKKHKEGRVTEQGDEESPRKRKKRKQHKSHRVTEGDEEPRRKRSKRD